MNLDGFSIRAFDLWIPAVSQMLVLFTIGVVPCCSCCNGVFRCCCHKQTTCCCSFGRVFRHDCVCVLAVVFRFLDGVWMGSSLHLWPIIHQCERRRAAQCCSAAEIVFSFFNYFSQLSGLRVPPAVILMSAGLSTVVTLLGAMISTTPGLFLNYRNYRHLGEYAVCISQPTQLFHFLMAPYPERAQVFDCDPGAFQKERCLDKTSAQAAK